LPQIQRMRTPLRRLGAGAGRVRRQQFDNTRVFKVSQANVSVGASSNGSPQRAICIACIDL
jgi:hypothetical protein